MIKAMFSKVAAWFKESDEVPVKAQPAPHVPRWTLSLGSQTLGEFTFVGYETPWKTADFKPTEHFERFKPHFNGPVNWISIRMRTTGNLNTHRNLTVSLARSIRWVISRCWSWLLVSNGQCGSTLATIIRMEPSGRSQ